MTRIPLKKGAVVGGYTVRRYLGCGGFALTYLGADADGDVLIKEFYPAENAAREKGIVRPIHGCEQTFGLWLTAFVREARTLLALTGIAGVPFLKDFFEAYGTMFIVTDYLPSIPFATYVAQAGRLSTDETLALLQPVFHTLDAVHKRQVLHLDVSPDNILVGPHADVLLIDFGATGTIESGVRQHTDGYSAPELYDCDRPPDERADIYALAATVYRGITGCSPPAAPNRLRGNRLLPLPRSVARPLCHAMQLSPDDRPDSIRAFYEELYGKH